MAQSLFLLVHKLSGKPCLGLEVKHSCLVTISVWRFRGDSIVVDKRMKDTKQPGRPQSTLLKRLLCESSTKTLTINQISYLHLYQSQWKN